jgi:hypothetical protein
MSDHLLLPPTPPLDVAFEDLLQTPAPAPPSPRLFLADGPAAAHYVWTLEPESWPEERLLPKQDESELRGG